MNTSLALDHLAVTYPTARIRGRRVTRLDEQSLGWVVLDAPTAEELGREQLGWFVGNHPGLARVAEQLGRLDANPEGGVWVVATHSRDLAYELFTKWPHPDQIIERPKSSKTSVWRSRRVWVALPEDLKNLLPLARTVEGGVAGVIVLDPWCLLYKTRGGTDWRGNSHTNDRPQHVVNFRASLELDGWQPPLLLLTEQQSKAVHIEAVSRAFCLNAFQFIAGDSFGCWEVPIEKECSTLD